MMQSVKNVLEMKTVPVKQVDLKLPVGLLGRSLSRLPLHFLRDLLPQMGMPKELLGDIWTNLGQMQDVLMRLTLLSSQALIFSVDKGELTTALKERANQVNQTEVVQEALVMGFAGLLKLGLYQFLPAMTEGTSPDDHFFKEICCLGVTVPLQGVQVTGSWTIDGNMDLLGAKMQHPTFDFQPVCCQQFKDLLPFSLENTIWKKPPQTAVVEDTAEPPKPSSGETTEGAVLSAGMEVGHTQQPEKDAPTPAGSKSELLLTPTPAEKEAGSILLQSAAECKKRKVDEGEATEAAGSCEPSLAAVASKPGVGSLAPQPVLATPPSVTPIGPPASAAPRKRQSVVKATKG
eukprot:2809472-Amphidinium_carterae.2